MREIKFRGRSSKDNATWFTGSFVSMGDEAYIEHYDGLRRVMEMYPVVHATVGQFTGLCDSEGKEIYEGDVVRFTPPLRWEWEEDKRKNGVVVYEYFQFVVKYEETTVKLFHFAVNDDPFTVVDNIHDNPELVK